MVSATLSGFQVTLLFVKMLLQLDRRTFGMHEMILKPRLSCFSSISNSSYSFDLRGNSIMIGTVDVFSLDLCAIKSCYTVMR